jgi:hypothetical protein
MVRAAMRTFLDQLGKSLLGKLLPAAGRTDVGHQVAGQQQEVDVWFEPDPDRAVARARLGVLGRMVAQGPCLLEPFSSAPGVSEVRACMRKQLVIDHARTMEARRTGAPRLPFPGLWLLAAGQPETVLGQYRMQPMAGWPAGFWARAPVDRLHIVVLRALPRTRATLLLRLLGRGPTFRDAVHDLLALPDQAWERQVTLPVLIAFRMQIPHDSLEDDEMLTAEEIDAIYAKWERQIREEGREQGLEQGLEQGREQGREQGQEQGRLEGERTLLLKQLTRRFGPLPDHVLARVQQAGTAALERWAERILSAPSLEDVLAP